MSPLLLILSAWVGLSLLFAGLYLVCRRLDNYGFVDVAWSYAFALLAGWYSLGGPGWPARRILIASLAVIWSLRLGTHLLRRVAGHHPVEDGRYVQLRKDWEGNFGPKMAGFFQLQASSVVLLGLPFFLPVLNSTPAFHPLELLGAALWLVAIVGESVADAQLAAFKRNPAHRGQVCAVGLWSLSRHPNYFFEWMVWVSFLVIALGSPWGWLSVISPASILYLLLKVTGIPLTEEQSLRSKGEAYRRYQQTTSAFVPWLSKKQAGSDNR